MKKIFSQFAMAITLTCASITGALAVDAPHYTITALPPMPGDTHSGAAAINNSGQIAGWSGKVQGKRGQWLATTPVLWRNGQALRMGSHNMTGGAAIDGQGDVLIQPCLKFDLTGFLSPSKKTTYWLMPGLPHAMMEAVSLWHHDKLDELPLKMADCMTDGGSVLGTVEPDDGEESWCVWRNGKYTTLDDIVQKIMPRGMNDGGQIIGSVNMSQAAVYDHGKITLLPIPPGFAQTYSKFINASGQILFEADPPVPAVKPKGKVTATVQQMPERTAFLWSAGKFTKLGTGIEARAMNDHAQIIGTGSQQNGCLWQDGHLYPLPEIISAGSDWSHLSPQGINNAGQIGGEGLYKGQERGFIMTPAQG